ncbi:transcriptional regulator, luxR family [Actinoalloteichus sp. GBA129-24]|nr:transcriptional regulator, luxR family [Actinoalloteichus sp. GBA129-24]
MEHPPLECLTAFHEISDRRPRGRTRLGSPMSMRSMRRADAVAVLDESFRAFLGGYDRAVVVSGPMMSGKSRLLRDFADKVSAGIGTVFTATGSLSEHDVSMGIVEQLLRRAGQRTGPGTGLDQLRSHQSVDNGRALLADVVGGSPAVLVVDEVHHADAASVDALLYVLRRIVGTPVLVLLSTVDPAVAPAAALIAELSSLVPVRAARLRMLDVDDVAALLEVPLDDRRAEECHALCGGNPLLAEALVVDGYETGVLAPGETFKVAVSTCLYRGGRTVLEVARCLALLDTTSSRHLLYELADAPSADVNQAVTDLTVAGLLDDDGGFRHPAAQEVALATLTPAERGHAHRRIASLLHHCGADVPLAATHLVAALDADPGDFGSELPWAAELLVEAADFALRGDRPADTVRYAKAARSLTTAETVRVRALGLLVAARWRRNPSAAASHLGDLRAARRAGHLTGDGFELLLSTLAWNGHFAEAADVIRSIGDDTSTAVAEPALRWLHFVSPGSFTEPTSAAGDPGGGDLFQRAVEALGVALSGGEPARVAADADYVLQNGELSGIAVEPLMSILLALVYVDRLDDAEQWCLRLDSQFAARSLDTLRAVLLSVAAEVAYRRGDMPLARSRAASALNLISVKSWCVAVGYPVGTHVLASTALGYLDEAAELLRRPVPANLEDTAFALPYLYARGQHALATNRPYAALEDFRTCGRLMTSWDFDIPTFVSWRIGVGQAYLALGRPREAKGMFDKQLLRARGRARAVHAVSLRLLAETGLISDRRQFLEESVKLLQNSGHLLELINSLAELSNEYYARGDSERSRLTGRRAIEVSSGCDALGVAKNLLLSGERFDLTNLVDDDEQRYPQLTDAESRVAGLAAQGLTNREIGRKLFLSMSAVEQRLTRVFRKLGVSRRADLIGLTLARSAAPGLLESSTSKAGSPSG